MKTIWKWQVPMMDEFQIPMPAGAQLLSLQVQHGKPQLWALVDQNADAEMEYRWFRNYETGHVLPDDPGDYVGTYVAMDGRFVGHLFERKKR